MNIRGREGGREVNIDIEIINERGEGEGNLNETLIQNQINKGAMENKNKNRNKNEKQTSDGERGKNKKNIYT